MNRSTFPAWAALAIQLAAYVAYGQSTNGALSLAELRQRLEAHISQPRFASAVWGVKVVSFDTGQTVFEHHPDPLMSPASNRKQYTATLALDRLRGEFAIGTPTYATVKDGWFVVV